MGRLRRVDLNTRAPRVLGNLEIHIDVYGVYQELASVEPGALRHGCKVTSVTLPSRYTFPSVLRTKTRVVEDSVSGSS